MMQRLMLTMIAAVTVALLAIDSDTADAQESGPEPIAQWQFDGNALDATGNGHDATPLGGVEFAGGAAVMDGTDDAFQVADAPDLSPAKAITVEAWWNAVDFTGSGNNGLVDKGFTSHTPPHYQYQLGVNGTGWPGGPNFGFSVTVDGTAVGARYDGWTPGQTYHLVGTYDGSEVRLYVNGALEASRAASGSISDYGQDLFIGRYTNLQDEGVHFLPGTIDQVTIWGRALSSDEVADLYKGPRTGEGEQPANETDAEEMPDDEPEATAQQNGDDDGSGFPWWLIVVILVIVAALLLLLLFLRRRRREEPEA